MEFDFGYADKYNWNVDKRISIKKQGRIYALVNVTFYNRIPRIIPLESW